MDPAAVMRTSYFPHLARFLTSLANQAGIIGAIAPERPVRVPVQPSKQSDQPALERWLQTKLNRSGPAPGTVSAEAAAFNKQAAAFLELYDELQGALSGRFRLVRFVLSVYQKPREQWPEAVSGLREDHAGLALAMLDRLAAVPDHVRSLLIALDRFEDAARAAAEVRAVRARISQAPEAQHATIAASLSFPKLYGRIYLLSTLDVTFKDDPVLHQIFPTIERERIRKRPAPPPPPPSTTEQLVETAHKLQEGIGRLLKGR